MPEELISKQEATSHISAGVLRSTYIFKWVSAFKPNLLTHIAGTAVGNSFSVLALNLPVLCLLWFPDHWYRGAGLGAAMFMDGWLWGLGYSPFPLSFLWTPVLQRHDLALTKITPKECFSFTKTLCFYTCLSVVFHVRQIHLLQFHGTRYAAIDPSMVSAEELEVQKISLHTSNEQEEQ